MLVGQDSETVRVGKGSVGPQMGGVWMCRVRMAGLEWYV